MLSWSGAAPASAVPRPLMSEQFCAAVILAAGASTRLGMAKQLVEIEGEPLIVRSLRMAQDAGFSPAIVVIGCEAERMRAALSGQPAILVENRDWPTGMGSSLRCGMEALELLNPRPEAVLLVVCDQLALSTDLLRDLARVHAAGERGITASFYAERTGVPAIFAAKYFPALMQVEGDRGARGLLERHADDVATIAFDEGVKDLDTPDQLRELK